MVPPLSSTPSPLRTFPSQRSPGVSTQSAAILPAENPDREGDSENIRPRRLKMTSVIADRYERSKIMRTLTLATKFSSSSKPWNLELLGIGMTTQKLLLRMLLLIFVLVSGCGRNRNGLDREAAATVRRVLSSSSSSIRHHLSSGLGTSLARSLFPAAAAVAAAFAPRGRYLYDVRTGGGLANT